MQLEPLFTRHSQDGLMDRQQFQCAFIERMGSKLTDYQVKVLFREAGGRGCRQVGWEHFKDMMDKEEVGRDSLQERLFQAIDLRQQGRLSRDDLATLLHRHRLDYLHRQQLDSLFALLDQEDKGWVGVQDVKAFYRRFHIPLH